MPRILFPLGGNYSCRGRFRKFQESFFFLERSNLHFLPAQEKHLRLPTSHALEMYPLSLIKACTSILFDLIQILYLQIVTDFLLAYLYPTCFDLYLNILKYFWAFVYVQIVKKRNGEYKGLWSGMWNNTQSHQLLLDLHCTGKVPAIFLPPSVSARRHAD